jgi:hypothetical protein
MIPSIHQLKSEISFKMFLYYHSVFESNIMMYKHINKGIIMKEVIKKWWVWIIVGFVLGILIASCLNNTDNNKADNTEPVKPETVIVIPEITSIALGQAYHENHEKADNTYTGKEFIITGAILDIEVKADNTDKDRGMITTGLLLGVDMDIIDTPYITLSYGSDYPISHYMLDYSVVCMLKNKEDAIKLNKGDTVKIKGTIKGKLLNTYVINCEIVK